MDADAIARRLALLASTFAITSSACSSEAVQIMDSDSREAIRLYGEARAMLEAAKEIRRLGEEVLTSCR